MFTTVSRAAISHFAIPSDFPGDPMPAPVRRLSGDRVSDCWPDWSTPLDDAETRAFAARNTPSEVLGGVVLVLAASGLLVAALEIGLTVLHLR